MNSRSDRASLPVFVCSLLLMALCASPAADRTVLRGHVPPLTKGREPVGQPDPGEVLNLAVGIVPRDPEGLKTLLKELYDPQSPHFRQWLTTAEFTERFGPTTADYRSMGVNLSKMLLPRPRIHPPSAHCAQK